MNLTTTLKSSLIVTLMLAIAMLFLGALLAFIYSGSYFQFLTPLVFAVGCAFVVPFVVWRGNLHNLPIIILLCALFGVGIYTTNIVASYLWLKMDTSGGWYDGVNTYDDFDRFLEAVTGKSGVVGYVDYALDRGIQTQGSYSPGPQNQITGLGVLFYWVLDLVFIVAGCLWGGWVAYHRPYADRSARYFGFIPITNNFNNIEEIGTLYAEALPEFVAQLNAHRLEQAGSLLENFSGTYYVFLERCAECKEDPMNLLVAPQDITQSAKKVVHRHQITSAELNSFLTFAGARNIKSANYDEYRWFAGAFGGWLILIVAITIVLRFVDIM